MSKKFGGTRYNSRWDGSTWMILALVAVICIIPCVGDGGIVPVIICVAALAFIIVTLCGIYYRIDGEHLVIYQFFIPTAFPISKIKEIRPTRSVLSAPATSLTHRIAITFTDRKVLKSVMPMIISPVRQSEFIGQLLAVNHRIDISRIRNKC